MATADHRIGRDRTDAQRRMMPVALRCAIYVVFGGVWLTGCVWLLLHTYFETADDFGVAQHPWEPVLLRTHGVLSIAVAYLFGWIMARHAAEGWRLRKRRVGGAMFSFVIVVVSVSGFMLFFVANDQLQLQSARLHEVAGLLVTGFAIEHWRVVNGRRRGDTSVSSN
jgi:hypothetical protein